MSGYDTVLQALEEQGLTVSTRGDSVMARCPSHEDGTASLSLGKGDGDCALLYCHAGCATKEVVNALGLDWSDLGGSGHTGGAAVAATYVYTDEAYAPLYRVLRYSPKGFSQQRYADDAQGFYWHNGLDGTRRVLYRLPELLRAVSDGATIYVCEGEKDADNLAAWCGVATTTLLGGASKWREEYLPFFSGAHVVVVADKDDAGRQHAEKLVSVLQGVSATVSVRVSAAGKDITDHLLAGFGLDDLEQMGDGLDEFGPLDWTTYEREDTDWLLEPYIPRAGRVLAFGPAGSLKSLWAMWAAVRLAKEGKRVAYFSLEMLPSQTASRLKQLNPPKDNLYVFTKDLRLGSPSHTAKLIAGLAGFDLIVIDSWSSARAAEGRESNEAVAALDNDVLLPIINLTGASILILDNTGHPTFTDDGKHKADHARGASAKGDKMEVTLWFDRPYEDNNYQTQITVKKMRLDYPMPMPVRVETPRDRIEFYYLDERGMLGEPAWPGDSVIPDVRPVEQVVEQMGSGMATVEMTPAERRALARLKDRFKATESTDEPVPEVSAGDDQEDADGVRDVRRMSQGLVQEGA